MASSVRQHPRALHSKKIYVGEAFIKYDENLEHTDIKMEHLRARRDLFIDLADVSLVNQVKIDQMVCRLDRYIWRDPSLTTSQRALRYTKSMISDVFNHVRLNWFANFPNKFELIETGSYFSDLRVGLPFEFDFMFDVTSILPVDYSIERAHDFTERYFFSYESDPSQNTPNLPENIYYCIKTDDSMFSKATEFGFMFNVKKFCSSLYTAFGEALKATSEKWNFFDFHSKHFTRLFFFHVI